MDRNNQLQPPTPANTMYLTINGVPQLYYMLKQEEYMELQTKASNALPATVQVPLKPQPMDDDEEYWDREKVCKILHVDKSTLWRWAKEGKLGFIKVGPRRVLYKAEDIKNLLNNQK